MRKIMWLLVAVLLLSSCHSRLSNFAISLTSIALTLTSLIIAIVK